MCNKVYALVNYKLPLGLYNLQSRVNRNIINIKL